SAGQAGNAADCIGSGISGHKSQSHYGESLDCVVIVILFLIPGEAKIEAMCLLLPANRIGRIQKGVKGSDQEPINSSVHLSAALSARTRIGPSDLWHVYVDRRGIIGEEVSVVQVPASEFVHNIRRLRPIDAKRSVIILTV